MKFCISSHKDFYKSTNNKLLNSLLDSGVNIEDIYFFVGGYDRYTMISESPFVWHVPHNSFDLTSLISIIELDIASDWWYLLHDTCYVGKNFYQRLLNTNYTDCTTIRLHGTHDSMNIGAYSRAFLDNHRDMILGFKGNNEDSQNTKRKLVDHEDFFFKLDSGNHFFTNVLRQEGETIDFYNNGTYRKMYYYPDVDVYKIQANWLKKPPHENYITRL